MSRSTPQLTNPQQPIGGRLSAMTRSVSRYIFFGLLAYMPFHIFLSTWLGTSFGVLEFAKVAKDGVLVGGFLLALAVSVRQSWFKELLRSKLVLLILAYAGLTLFLAVTEPTDQDAEILGLVYNTRFLLFFLYGLLLTRLFPDRSLQSSAVKTVVISGILVVIFGVLQFLVLPNTALEHVGYSKQNGVLPAFFIDNKPDFTGILPDYYLHGAFNSAFCYKTGGHQAGNGGSFGPDSHVYGVHLFQERVIGIDTSSRAIFTYE